MRLDLRMVMNAILYVLRTGCAWRYLPSEYPNFNSVYYHFRKWSWDGTLEALNSVLRERVRREADREAQPSLAIIDSQSVKTTEVGGEHGFDGNKRINGRRRHTLVDSMGNLLGVVLCAANISDQNGAKELLEALPQALWERLEKILADGGYRGDLAYWIDETFGVDLQ